MLLFLVKKGRNPSSETQGQIVGARESLNRRKNKARRKVKNGEKSPLGTMSYQTSSKRLLPFWLLIGARKLVFFWHQSDGRNPGGSLKFNDQYQRHQQYHRQLKHPYWSIAFNFHTSLLHLRNHGITQEKVTKIEVFFKGWGFNLHAEIFVAWENSQHLVTLPLVSLPNDVWEMSARIPYRWRVTTQI